MGKKNFKKTSKMHIWMPQDTAWKKMKEFFFKFFIVPNKSEKL